MASVRIGWLALIGLCCAAQAGAHGGGLNAEGCHHDRKRGGYHCHRGPAAGAASLMPDAAPRQRRQQPQDLAPSALTAESGATYYRNCNAARAAGAAPVRRGDPGYGPHLDRDGDGKGCE
ncbi:excalibur calcium-binding domain protein [Lysobacter capsici]|uniref:excalibur calcium-binding domain-containing protein n=1 Tax=Lysobacter capsici TaxID=435897 RepID=UPI000721B6B0|nr:excalibur calcium-binding domain-containing protein [Lysobacter capsici]ALN83985.1 excalibur calcium-binding domain protein [Lysobacter capsici]